MTWAGVVTSGTGRASVMHEGRGTVLEKTVGHPLYPGTLNLSLGRPFAWDAPCQRIIIPDAVDWADLGGRWTVGYARLWPVTVDSIEAWVLRLDRSSAGPRAAEILSAIRLRDHVGDIVTLRLR